MSRVLQSPDSEYNLLLRTALECGAVLSGVAVLGTSQVRSVTVKSRYIGTLILSTAPSCTKAKTVATIE